MLTESDIDDVADGPPPGWEAAHPPLGFDADPDAADDDNDIPWTREEEAQFNSTYRRNDAAADDDQSIPFPSSYY